LFYKQICDNGTTENEEYVKVMSKIYGGGVDEKILRENGSDREGNADTGLWEENGGTMSRFTSWCHYFGMKCHEI
jgi:hypothetical protein